MTPRAGKLVRPGCAVPTRLLSVRLCFFPYTLRGDRVLVARQSVYHRTPCPRIEYIRSPVVAALVRSLVTSAPMWQTAISEPLASEFSRRAFASPSRALSGGRRPVIAVGSASILPPPCHLLAGLCRSALLLLSRCSPPAG